jgi:hypothetical protein
MVAFGTSLPDDVFMVQPWSLDKLGGGYRRAGPRLYRAALLMEAIQLIPQDGQQLRPESWVLGEMARRGHRSATFDYAVGLHDYEQYYRDVYRKSYVHGVKHLDWAAKLIHEWKRRSAEDLDYWVALHGFWAGLMSRGGVRLDVEAFPRSIETLLAEVQATEKSPLRNDEIGPAYVESRLNEAGRLPHRRTRVEKLREARDRLGWGRMAPWFIGKGLSRLGTALQDFAGAGPRRPGSSGPMADQ